MATFHRMIREIVFILLAYLDDFLVAPSPYGVVSDIEAVQKAKFKISALIEDLGLIQNLKKGEWLGRTSVANLCFIIYSVAMKFSVTP